MSAEEAAPAGSEVEVLTLDVGDDLGELARVRAWVRAELRDVAEAALADTILVLDEVVSNALRHGKPPLRVRLLRQPGSLRVEADDAGKTVWAELDLGVSNVSGATADSPFSGRVTG
ncbi:ATP-binding protein [Amycolatopsis speibonae]|uniref:ATP-binding protein n=1 Tax=Amycolatopsis speibonae TaxID=1450224 RepID=A0ABV7P2Z7_9PSEU